MRIFFLLIVLLVLCTSCAAIDRQESTERVLFVGNSLTYFGNVPAIYAELCAVEGRVVSSDMIVVGGATLSQRVADGSAERALTARKYTTLVLQERGGDLICSFGPESCVESRQAIKLLADVAKGNGVAVVLLGTYQGVPAVSRELVEKESKAAADAGIPYVEVSGQLQHLRSAAPDLLWFAEDGMHPGKDLALLNALLVYRTLHGSLPQARAITVSAPVYGHHSGLTEELREADAPAPNPGTPDEMRYSAETLQILLRGISSDDT